MTKTLAPRLSQRLPFGLISLGAIVLGSILGADATMAQERARNHQLEYRLEAVGPATPKSAKVRFVLTNRGSDPARILLHNTPLKGVIETRMFAIHCNDDETPLRYQGLMRSTEKPADTERASGKIELTASLRDNVLLDPGQSREATVDLAPVYPLPATGNCRVTFSSLLNVVDLDGAFGGRSEERRVGKEC